MKGDEHATQRNIIIAGNPSVSFFFQLYHTCGKSWIHQKTVPIVPSTVAAIGMFVCAGIFARRGKRSRKKLLQSEEA